MQRKPPPVLLATASYDRTIRFWEAPSGICMRTLNFQDSQVNCMCISPDRAYLAAGGNKHIRLYDLSATLQVPASTIESHAGNITSLVYLKDGKYLLSASEDGMIKIWDTRTMAMKKKFDVKASVNSMALCPDQCTIVSGDQMGRVSLWNSKSNDEPFDLTPAGDVGIRTVAASQQPGGLICAANNSGEVFAMKLVEVENSEADKETSDGEPRHKKYKLILMHTFKAHNKVCIHFFLHQISVSTYFSVSRNLFGSKADISYCQLLQKLLAVKFFFFFFFFCTRSHHYYKHKNSIS